MKGWLRWLRKTPLSREMAKARTLTTTLSNLQLPHILISKEAVPEYELWNLLQGPRNIPWWKVPRELDKVWKPRQWSVGMMPLKHYCRAAGVSLWHLCMAPTYGLWNYLMMPLGSTLWAMALYVTLALVPLELLILLKTFEFDHSCTFFFVICKEFNIFWFFF